MSIATISFFYFCLPVLRDPFRLALSLVRPALPGVSEGCT